MNKTCSQCKNTKPISEYGKNPKNGDRLQSYCKQCNLEQNRLSKMRRGETWYSRDGFRTEEDHFNYSLRHYATIFNTPSLLKHLTNTGSIQRYDNNAKPL